ncbi:dehydrogenase [Actinobacillus pleuropneumoniae]|nr:dehydrogenase [Actinobacillus pleuropneumoniae]
MFVTCLSDALFPRVAESMARLLARYGVQLEFPEIQTCCGQPAYNSGYWEEARISARTILDAFDDSDFVVSPSGSCTYMIHHYPDLFKDDSVYLDKAKALQSKCYEFTQFLVDVLGVTDVGAVYPHKVTYHPSCHGSRLLGVKDEPMKLLSHVKGLELVPCRLPRIAAGSGERLP